MAEAVQEIRATLESIGRRYFRRPFKLTEAHFQNAKAWDDGIAMLRWATETESTVAEMRAYHWASRGEDLCADE